MNQLRDISVLCKDVSSSILVVGGGAHISALPVESMNESCLDVAVAGEGDMTFGEVCDGRKLSAIKGIYYRDGGGQMVFTGTRPLIENLDDLALPAWHLYDPAVYRTKVSRILVRNRPATIAEFSRGCVFKCDFCASKMTMGLGYRKKSPERCAEETRVMARLGWREFMLADDIFTSDNWACNVADAIGRAGTGVTWTCNNGIRVESADDRLFRSMRKAGCYRVSFGFESGSDAVLKAFGKGGRASLALGQAAVRKARAAGVETNGYFLLGLSPDTADTMRETIAFARRLELDIMKFGVTIALPGTPMFKEYADEGRIRSYNWDDYFVHSTQELFAHRHLDHATVQHFMTIAYREAMLANPRFVMRRFVRGVRTGEFFWDLYYFLKFLSLPANDENAGTYDYYARDRWPQHDFRAAPLETRTYQVALKPRVTGGLVRDGERTAAAPALAPLS